MRTKHAFVAALSLVAVAFVGIMAVGGALGRKTEVHDDAVYYRVKVGLSHKGEPIDFDVVVGCGARVSSDGYSGASIDIVGWDPFVYAKEIPGGHAVLLRTTVDGSAQLGEQPCRGGTSTDGSGNYRTPNAPGVAADWLPILVWYEHADDLSHGLAYVTQDAYASPEAQLEFHGATIEHATRADFDHFRATAPKNLMPRYLADNLCCTIPGRYKTPADVPPDVVADPRKAWTKIPRPACYGIERIRLDEAQRARVRALWPADHPRFWSVPGYDQPNLLLSFFVTGPKENPNPEYREFFRYAVPDTPERQAIRPQVFPASMPLALNRLNKDTGHDSYDTQIEIGDGRAHRGMMSCDSEASEALERAVSGRFYFSGRPTLRVCLLDGIQIFTGVEIECIRDRKRFVAFENDEYMLTNWDLDQIAL